MEKIWKNIDSLYIKALDLEDAIKLSNEDIITNVWTIYVRYNTLINNFDEFLRVIKALMDSGINVINVENYDCVKYINNNLKDRLDLTVNILDDYENKMRSYINFDEIDKIKFTVPINYLMWNINFNNILYLTSASYNYNALYANGNTSIYKDTLLKIKEIILYLKSLGKFSDLQIIILVSNYLQRNVEYIVGNKFEDDKMIYKLNHYCKGIEKEVGLIETVLFKHYGLCMGIANATTILLNNPEFNINARTILTNKHALNIVKYNGKYYYLDNTYGITRSPKEFMNAIKPITFNSKYLLFGKKEFEYNNKDSIISTS